MVPQAEAGTSDLITDTPAPSLSETLVRAPRRRRQRREITGRPPSQEAVEKGAVAYACRLTGMTWGQIAEVTGVTKRRGRRYWQIVRWADRHAFRNRLPWPVGRDN